MKKLRIISAALVIVALTFAACALVACNNDDSTQKPLSALRVENGVLVDADGSAVALRGTNLGGWLVQEGWMCPTVQTDSLTTMKTLYSRFGKDKAEELIDVYEDNWITDVDFANIAALGLNVVRIPFTYMTLYDVLDSEGNLLPPDEYTLRSDAFERLDRAIGQCAANGLYAILDLHGAAGSQNGCDHSGDTSDIRLFDDDEYGEACRANTVAIWTALAERYAGNTTVAAFDLLNEPTGRMNKTTTEQFELYDLLYDAIRARDPDRIVIMESVWDFGQLPKPSEYGWENVIYEFHHYNRTENNQANAAFYSYKILDSGIYNHGVPVLIGEFNAWGDAGRNATGGNPEQTDAEAYEGVLELYTGKGWHWTTWTYKVNLTSGNWGLYLLKAAGESVNPETDTEEEIRAKWSVCRTADAYGLNNEIAAMVSQYAAAAFGVKLENGFSILGR